MTSSSEFDACSELAASGKFDPAWYLRAYPDVSAAGMDPVIHYVRYGRKEGRSRNQAEFDKFMGVPDLSSIDSHASSRPSAEHLPEIPIVFAVNREFIKYASVAMVSLIEHASPAYFYKIHILHTGVEVGQFAPIYKLEQENVSISPIDVAPMFGDLFAGSFVSHTISKDTYLRLLIPSLFDHYQKVLYLDSDLIVCAEISQFYHEDISGYALGGVAEPIVDTPFFQEMTGRVPFELENNYFNAGALLMNIEELNSSGKARRALDMALSGERFLGQDQEILNLVCHGSIRAFPMRWNVLWMHLIGGYYKNMKREDFLLYAQALQNPAIIHFTSQRKPWNIDDGYFSEMFWKYAQKSPYYAQILAECPYVAKVSTALTPGAEASGAAKKISALKKPSRRRKFDFF